jgi:hypothetical protein
MNLKSSLPRLAAAVVILTASFTANAAPGLSHQQCLSYPFKKAVGGVTHADLMKELSELEARGYAPGSDNGIYPADLNAAEKSLAVDYRHDCVSSH